MESIGGKPAAALSLTLAHVSPSTLTPFRWPQRAWEKAETVKIEVPDFARPRGVGDLPPTLDANLEEADALDV